MRKNKYKIDFTENTDNIERKKLSKDYKRQVRFTVVSIFFVTIVMITGAYAIFSDVQRQESENTLTVGKLKIDFTDTEEGLGNAINLNGAYPIADTEGLQTTPYKFKITNSGNLDAAYTVKIVDDEEVIREDGCQSNLLAKSNIRVSINGETPFTLSDMEASSYAVETGKLAQGQSKTYEIRIWIAENAGNEVLGKHYHGKILIESENTVIPISAAYKYTYNATTNPAGCITGEEDSCEKTTCYMNKTAGSCPAGTIIKYKVNNNEEKYFYVLHDDGKKITMQQRENTVYNVAWYSPADDFTHGPVTILDALENETSSWTNVNDITYTAGTTTLYDNPYTGCLYGGSNTFYYEGNAYTLESKTVKARMITMQEAVALGCNTDNQSCPTWMNNYLSNSTDFGGTVNDSTGGNYGYWTMSAPNDYSGHAWFISFRGRVYNNGLTTDNSDGPRAVVEVNK